MLEEILRILTYDPDSPNKQSSRGIPHRRSTGMFLRKDESISSVYPSGDLQISMTKLHNHQGER